MVASSITTPENVTDAPPPVCSNGDATIFLLRATFTLPPQTCHNFAVPSCHLHCRSPPRSLFRATTDRSSSSLFADLQQRPNTDQIRATPSSQQPWKLPHHPSRAPATIIRVPATSTNLRHLRLNHRAPAATNPHLHAGERISIAATPSSSYRRRSNQTQQRPTPLQQRANAASHRTRPALVAHAPVRNAISVHTQQQFENPFQQLHTQMQ
ncbi:hypothetical protein DEO72_LG8g2018 [Vigna unguiculata]|uniref:Uncharacterized protein n=1 Tax=Vigna unguiculata TaxID=3917 RepID=A0A4D6MR69_VIGUN|nr:hypothetical protein DEO72_LG8g2018 [Vigna unguiculata]